MWAEVPCRSDYMEPTPGEHKETQKVRQELEALGDRATYSSDVLREYLLGNSSEREILPHVNKSYEWDEEFEKLSARADKLYVKVPLATGLQVKKLVDEYVELDELANRMEPPTKKQLTAINKKQVAHRKADVARLLKSLGAAGDVERLRKVLDVDTSKPLVPQLGFSPDEF